MSTETRRIESILRLLKQFPARSGCGLDASAGLEALDDCAVVPLNPTSDLVIGTDFVRGEGFYLFRKGILTWKDVGYYLIGANASDLAAMGACPLGVVVVLRYTSQMTDKDYEEIMAGVLSACSDFELPLLGGDSGGYESSVLSAAAFGICPHDQALLRSRGEEGDLLMVTGDVGTAGAALSYFTRGKEEGMVLSTEIEAQLANAWRKVKPALKIGQLLVEKRYAKCAIDTSDGLKASCRQIAEASNLDAILHADAIPISQLARQVATGLRVDPLAFAVGDSVDFRLVFSCHPSIADELRREFAERNWSLHEIGYLARPQSAPTVYLKTAEGLRPVPGIEWAQSETLSVDQLRAQDSRKA
jgi:thiamine-monophosphate kinase